MNNKISRYYYYNQIFIGDFRNIKTGIASVIVECRTAPPYSCCGEPGMGAAADLIIENPRRSL
jgi:hypothetical protein